MKRDIQQLSDFKGSLGSLKNIVDSLIEEYGEDKIIEFDAGYNNISAYIWARNKK